MKETKSPVVAIVGFALAPSAGVVPSAVEIRKVVGVQVLDARPLQVSRTNTCGVTPSNVTFETRFDAVETKATNRPSELMAGLKLSPVPALRPSAEIETICACTPVPVQVGIVEHAGRQKTWRAVPLSGTVVSIFVALEVKATCAPALSITGSLLAPFAEDPFASVLRAVVEGMQPLSVTQVLRR